MGKPSKHIYISRKRAKKIVVSVAIVWTILGFGLIAKFASNKNAERKLPKTVDNFSLETFESGDLPVEKIAFKPIDGYKYVFVKVGIKNIGKEPVWLAPVLQTYIKDSNDRQYGIEVFNTYKPLEGRQYQPNELASGELAYMVPNNDRILKWCLTSGEGQNLKSACMPVERTK